MLENFKKSMEKVSKEFENYDVRMSYNRICNRRVIIIFQVYLQIYKFLKWLSLFIRQDSFRQTLQVGIEGDQNEIQMGQHTSKKAQS